MDGELTISNGLAWSLDHRTMYLTDTLSLSILAYDFDPETGAIANRRTLVRTPKGDGEPDGLSVDVEGFLWSVRCRAAKVVRYDPTGRLDREIPVPVSCPTSCAFGGAALDELYITSSLALVPGAARAVEPQAGGLFRLTVGVPGNEEPRFAGVAHGVQSVHTPGPGGDGNDD